MKKIYITPELEVTIFRIDKELLGSDNESGPANQVTNAWANNSEPESTSDFDDMPW